jgi:hypothetical protein
MSPKGNGHTGAGADRKGGAANGAGQPLTTHADRPMIASRLRENRAAIGNRLGFADVGRRSGRVSTAMSRVSLGSSCPGAVNGFRIGRKDLSRCQVSADDRIFNGSVCVFRGKDHRDGMTKATQMLCPTRGILGRLLCFAVFTEVERFKPWRKSADTYLKRDHSSGREDRWL